jgi:hypothetical protein
MVNFLQITEHPQINHECFFEVMRDFRKGGLSPIIYKDFIEMVKNLPSIYERKPADYNSFKKFSLKDVTDEDKSIITKELIRRGIEKSKICWHPKASDTNCKVDNRGKIIVSAAHSLQNNGVLSNIAENGHVMSYTFDKGDFDGKELGKNHASIFWGFCNTHDAIFRPIEVTDYIKTDEQNFLYAYRGFVVSSHKKVEVSSWMNYGEQSDNDIKENKKIFDNAILANDFSVIETEIFELPLFYPIAASSSFYLDFDFEGNEIPHSDERMEDIFVTLFPSGVNKTYFLLSYFKQDRHLYKNLGDQLRKRDNLKSDISMLIAAHVENVYFNPVYYKTFIEKHEDDLMKISHEAQMDYASLDENDQIKAQISLTPNNYLTNPYKINFFGY